MVISGGEGGGVEGTGRESRGRDTGGGRSGNRGEVERVGEARCGGGGWALVAWER